MYRKADKRNMCCSKDGLELTANARRILVARYLFRDETGKVCETAEEMFARVARKVASADRLHGKKSGTGKTEREFFRVMTGLEFLPNTPALINAGLRNEQLAACFVLPVDDSLSGIFGAVKNMSLIHQSGGGTGFSFSRLRPKGDVVRSTAGIASGPVSFMRAFDTATDIIKQGGRRRGANMGILRCDHPDILEFITAKTRKNAFVNFNLSVAATDDFMENACGSEDYRLVNPRTGRVVKRLPARRVFETIVDCAWKTGDPGLFFIDEANRHNPTPEAGEFESTNPCGEQPLLANESCVLGSLNLLRMVKNGQIDWEKLEKTARVGVHFLDNVIDVCRYPIPRVKRATLANRKIGLGVMGFAEMLIELGMPYDSEAALRLACRLMKFITRTCRDQSSKLARQRGVFPNFAKSVWKKKGIRVRNATVTTIAPTGTISAIAGTSSGIEPLFALSFNRVILEGENLFEVNPYFEKIARDKGFGGKDILKKVARTGSVQKTSGVPRNIKKLFKTALDITPEWHVRMQAAFQTFTDNAVSKTVNLPGNAGKSDVRKVFLLAHQLRCKGVTVYRYGSKSKQVLYVGSQQKKRPVTVDGEFAGGCPEPYCIF